MLLPPYTRLRKDTSTKADNAGSLQSSTQQQTVCDQLNSTVSHSPFARPGSQAGASTAPATPTGMPSASASPFARPGSRAGSAQLEVDFPSAAPQAARSSSCNSTISSIDDPVFPREANTSTSWDVIDPDCNEEVAGITNGQSQHQVNRPANVNTDSDPFNQDLGLKQVSDTNSTNNLGTLYNQDFFIADTTNRRLSQVPNKTNYPYPLPKIDEMYAKLKGAKFFSTIDLRSGYYHIALGKDSRAKTAFVMPFGKYEFLQVPFGLAQAPAFFQHLMNKVLDNCSFAMTYLDDIIIFSNTEEEHLAHIEEIFRRLEAADLKMKRSKCDFFKKHIHYLGHLISADGIRPLKDKLDTIRDMPAPCSSKEVKQFLGLAGYYRKFVPRFADLSRTLA